MGAGRGIVRGDNEEYSFGHTVSHRMSHVYKDQGKIYQYTMNEGYPASTEHCKSVKNGKWVWFFVTCFVNSFSSESTSLQEVIWPSVAAVVPPVLIATGTIATPVVVVR